jgi:NAD(P)-dependent dehydrogenase (short-subunit alcohol dehydrogenase family)
VDLGIEDKVALVSGADSGIGWHTARMLLEAGARVAITDVDQARLDEAASRLPAAPDRLHAFAADVTDLESLELLRAGVEEHLGRIDILVQSSGTTGATGAFHETDDAGWLETLDVDLMGPVRLVRTFLPHLRAGGWGRIVLIASEDASQPYEDEIPYSAAKAGVLALMKGLSRAYATDGVLVNAVSPAFIHTPMTDTMMQEQSKSQGISFDDAVEQMVTEKRPFMALKRRGEPGEVAAVVAFLCSARSSFVTGANYRVDAGSVGAI